MHTTSNTILYTSFKKRNLPIHTLRARRSIFSIFLSSHNNAEQVAKADGELRFRLTRWLPVLLYRPPRRYRCRCPCQHSVDYFHHGWLVAAGCGVLYSTFHGVQHLLPAVYDATVYEWSTIDGPSIIDGWLTLTHDGCWITVVWIIVQCRTVQRMRKCCTVSAVQCRAVRTVPLNAIQRRHGSIFTHIYKAFCIRSSH